MKLAHSGVTTTLVDRRESLQAFCDRQQSRVRCKLQTYAARQQRRAAARLDAAGELVLTRRGYTYGGAHGKQEGC